MEFANSIGNWDKLSQIHYGIRSLVEDSPFHLLPPIYRWLKRHAKLSDHASVQYLYIATNIKEYLTIISIAIYRFCSFKYVWITKRINIFWPLQRLLGSRLTILCAIRLSQHATMYEVQPMEFLPTCLIGVHIPRLFWGKISILIVYSVREYVSRCKSHIIYRSCYANIMQYPKKNPTAYFIQ